MRALLGPRFGVEATFIVVVAILAGLLELPLGAILAAVFGAWLIVAVAELAASRRAAVRALQPQPPTARLAAPPPPPAPLSAPIPTEDDVPVEEVPAPVVVELEPQPAPRESAEPGDPEPARPHLAAVPPPEPDDEPAVEPEPEPEPEPAVVALRPEPPRAWNLWDIERRVQELGGAPAAGEERAFMLMYLRAYASPDGALPVEFDALVRESFADVLGVER